MRRINKRDRDNSENNLPTLSPRVNEIPEVEEVTDSESEEDIATAPIIRKHSSRRVNTNKSVRRSQRIAGKQPQYMGLFCHIEGEGDVLDVEAF